MNLSRITTFKILFYIFTLSLFLTSCEPEEIPITQENQTLIINKTGTTGDQEGDILSPPPPPPAQP